MIYDTSDTTQSQSRPHFNIQSHQLNGSAVEDVWSPVEPSPTSPIPSSPAHSGYGLHSPVPPWATGNFLDLPPAMYGPHPQAFRGSDTSSVGSSSPNLEWSGSTSSFGPELYEPQDNSLHPPMQLPPPWDQNYLTPTGPMMYRHGNVPSLLSSDTSSIASPGPSTDWDAMSSYSDLPAQDTETNGEDENSPKSNSSAETERAASRMGDDFAHKLQLQDDNAYYPTHFAPPTFRMSADAKLTGLGEIPTHHHRDNMTLFGTEGQIGEFGGESGAFRRIVSTEAGRRASKIRRKGAARFFCEICPSDFTAKHNLRNHMKSHESIKDFLCDMCGRGFGTKHVLERHKPKCNSRASAPRRSFKDAA
ncbi:hypothetical protein K438DRAFT_73948 [Mycena galopus ATCC 62051]|nr:hypothetical protein K438DRAFT_73948 [Mycena galopus ATCC 62051]